MAQVNLGSIKFKWKGTYNGATSYTADDVVEYNGSSYICILASTGNLPTNATYFEQMSQKGTDADLLNIASTAQGDIYYNNGSAIARLGAGTSGQFLKTLGTGANPTWGDVVGGVKQVKQVKLTSTVGVSLSAQGTYYDVSGLSLNFTPTASDSAVLLFGMFNMATVTTNDNRTRMRILRDSTHITESSSAGSRMNSFFNLYQVDGYEPYNGSLVWYDTPNTTSQVTYKIQVGSNTNTSTLYINRSQNDADNVDNVRGVSQLIAVEIDSGVL